MGAYLSEPMTTKESEDGEGNKIKYGACSMQGWRVTQEDAHNCIASFDEKSSLFAVYDGHGGAEVAMYLSKHLPDFLKSCDAYKDGEFVKALKDCFMKIDESIKTPEILKEIQRLAKQARGEDEGGEAAVDYEEENIGTLYEEATMPLDKLVAKYQSGSEGEESKEDAQDPDCKPGSSKSLASTPGSSSKSTEPCSSSSGSSSSTAVGSSSSSTTPAPATSSPVKTNGDGNAPSSGSSSSAEKPSGSEEVVSSSSNNITTENLKTEENGSSSTKANNDMLIVEGQKMEIKCLADEEKANDKPVNGKSANEEESKPQDAQKGEVAVMNGASTNSNNAEAAGKLSESSSIGEGDAPGVSSSTPETPRRKKVHPTPIPVENNKPERRSPRKNKIPAGSFEYSDSDDSEDEDDDEVGSSESLEDDDDGNEEETDSSEEDYEEDDEDDEEDERFLNDVQEPVYDSGCTAVVGFMKWEADGLSLWVANVGDSRCVVCREGKAVDMSHDHKPESDEEAKRIVNAGGKVTEDGRVNGGLNLSRAIGDHSYKQNTDLPPEDQMISPVPTVEHIVLNPTKDKFVVLACDGIWNSMSSQEVVDFVGSRIDRNEPLSKICEELFDSCLSPDTYGDGTGCDNMTAIIIKLSDAPESFSGSKRRFNSGDENCDAESSENSESVKKSRVETE